mgnify:CR=1 FL=1|tara:strand:- start:189 stop:506 length:318 start_codon:yes stop_codon:yes gene_type:complete
MALHNPYKYKQNGPDGERTAETHWERCYDEFVLDDANIEELGSSLICGLSNNYEHVCTNKISKGDKFYSGGAERKIGEGKIFCSLNCAEKDFLITKAAFYEYRKN